MSTILTPRAALIRLLPDGSSCLRRLPSKEDDGPKACRYRCTTCSPCAQDGEPECRDDRLPGRIMRSTQMNLIWKHMSSDSHFNKHNKLNPLSSNQMYDRVCEVLPKLRLILSRSTRKGDKVYFTEGDVQALELQALSDPDTAYREAFRYGMQGNVRNAKVVVLTEDHCPMSPNYMPPNMPAQPPLDTQANDNQSRPVSMDVVRRSTQSQTNPAQVALSLMYRSTQAHATKFNPPTTKS